MSVTKPCAAPVPGCLAATSGRLTFAVTVVTVPSTLTWTLIGAVVSGSIAQPVATMSEPPPEARATDSNEPYGSRFIVTVVQLGELSAEPYIALTAIAHTVCLPLGTVSLAVNMWPEWLPPDPLASTEPADLPSTVVRTVIGAVVSGSIAQPDSTAFEPCCAAPVTLAVGFQLKRRACGSRCCGPSRTCRGCARGRRRCAARAERACPGSMSVPENAWPGLAPPAPLAARPARGSCPPWSRR